MYICVYISVTGQIVLLRIVSSQQNGGVGRVEAPSPYISQISWSGSAHKIIEGKHEYYTRHTTGPGTSEPTCILYNV